jgi:hypothetical protein
MSAYEGEHMIFGLLGQAKSVFFFFLTTGITPILFIPVIMVLELGLV